MLERWYKLLWQRIGGRPWTYIIQDNWKRYQFAWIIGLVTAGVWLGHNYDWRAVITGWLVFSLGYLAGHLFWPVKEP